MTRDPRFDVLFEPVKLGPVTAPNRFYQVPHCTGMGYSLPRSLARMREIKAEGGWGVVNTEYCSIHPSSDDMSYPFASLWDDEDISNMALMSEGVHRHGSLAGVELWYGGHTANYHSRETALDGDSRPAVYGPWQSQRMDLDDMRKVRAWHKAAALRARAANFDIVYVYAGHKYMLSDLLDPATNNRRDAYGGVWQNRSRLFREILADTKDAIGGRCAIAVRIEVSDDDGGGKEERSELLSMIAAEVDLFDVTVSDYSREMGASRFVKEASLEADVAHIRALTGKPVVTVGRFTSPETMLSQVRRGIVDLIGAARPSIADPFLPEKIREGRLEDIRECIGCNICYAYDSLGAPIRCTQNPTMGEEWRRGWHPEKVNIARNAEPVLIIGAGPAGLEAAVTLGKRGVPVMLAEAAREPGGRVSLESNLPGLSEWARVRDWRVEQIKKLPNVEVYLSSPMSSADVSETGVRHVLVATGSHWRDDGRGTSQTLPVGSFNDQRTFSVDAILRGERPKGDIVVYDDENYYMAATLAELFARDGQRVTYVTTKAIAASFCAHTQEQPGIQRQLLQLGVNIVANTKVSGLGPGCAILECMYSGASREVACSALVPVTSREPDDALWLALKPARLETLVRIGDCKAPGIIAQAVYDGHKAAREFGVEQSDILVRRERVTV